MCLMTSAAAPVRGLVVERNLLAAWRSVGAPEPLGLAGAIVGDRGAVVAVLPQMPRGEWSGIAAPALASALGTRSVEVVLVPGARLSELVREWVYQAGQGSGRGVHLRVELDEDRPGSDDQPAVWLLVRAIDSSARELALRLASPTEPALPALRAVLGGRRVEVIDAEDARTATDRVDRSPSPGPA